MASISTGTKTEKLSFAKVAAAGLKPSNVQQSSSRADGAKKQDTTSTSPDGATLVSPSKNSNNIAFTPKQKIAALATAKSEEIDSVNTSKPEAHVQVVDSTSSNGKLPRALDGMLMPASTDDARTQASSSDSVKPPSLDGKSITSGTTFALDEKESLRPDDSASVKARDDEDVFSPPDLSLPESQLESEDDMRAFRDQLREISGMEPATQPVHPQGYVDKANLAQRVLYVPPQGPGVGHLPGAAIDPTIEEQCLAFPPDPKLLEALESPKDRIMVLKLEQDIVDFVKDAKESSLKLPQTNTFYRMLAHKLADYYMLGHVVDESTMAVRIFKTPNCRLPPSLTGIATPSTAASTPPPMGPQMKILRRGVDGSVPTIANGSNATSKTTSENGESGNEDEKKSKLFTREEREARYEAARKRIMGSAKPSESPEEPVGNENSRSSSATGRRNNREKQRGDSDDGFEARSAYSAYFTAPAVTPNHSMTSPYAFPSMGPSHVHQFSGPQYNNQVMMGNYPQYGSQSGVGWPHPSFHTQQGNPNWMHQQAAGYDLSGDFQRVMSFQPPPPPPSNTAVQQSYGMHYNQPISTPQQHWLQPNPYVSNYPTQAAPGFSPSYPPRTPLAANQIQETQSYPYGQLPSQAFPGRPPSKLEHPLPGSYKSKHFNPQSQSFIPGQVDGMSPMPFQPGAPATNNATYTSGYGLPKTPQRQNSTPSQNVMTGSPQQVVPIGGPTQVPHQPMTHPLPQPVFPQQPSPNVPLPPKPEATPPRPAEHTTGPAIVSSTSSAQNQSSIAKWGTASLPAKPPPSAEPFDPTKFVQSQRQSSGSNRIPSNMPVFGSMPPATGGVPMSGQNLHTSRRA